MPAEEAALKVQHASTSQTRNFTLLARTGSPSCVAHSRQTPQKYGLCVSQLLDNGYGVYELFNMLGFFRRLCNKAEQSMWRGACLLASGVLQYCNHKLSGASQNNASSHGTCSTANSVLQPQTYSRASQNNASKHGTCSTGKQRTAWSITKQCFQARYLLYWQAAYCDHSRASQNNALRG